MTNVSITFDDTTVYSKAINFIGDNVVVNYDSTDNVSCEFRGHLFKMRGIQTHKRSCKKVKAATKIDSASN